MNEDSKVRWYCKSALGDLPKEAQLAEWSNERFVWGTQVMVVDEDQHSSKASLIVKSDEGRRNLYSLLTEGGREESDPTVTVSRDLLEKYRTGLLVGAAWDGEIMSAAIRGEDEDALANLLKPYGFVELNPMEIEEMGSVELPEIGRIRSAALKADTICVRSPEDFKALCEPTPVIEQTKAPFIYSGGDNLIKGLCRGALKQKYPNGAPPRVEKRMEEELDIICRNGYMDMFLIAKEIGDAVRGNGYPMCTTGEIGASIVAFMLGITDIDPLMPHGVDDGYVLPWEMVFDISGARSPSISIQIPSRLRDNLFKLLRAQHGNVFYTTMADWEDENVDHIVILPEGVDVNRYTPLHYKNDKGMDETLISPFDYTCLDYSLMVQNVVFNPLLDHLNKLEQITGVSSNDIKMDDKEVLKFFCEKREDENVDFNRVLNLIGDTAPVSFRELVDILGKSMATWRNESPMMEKPFSCREDIMNDMLGSGLSREEAFTIMTRVRKGKGLTKDMEELVKEARVPEGYVLAMKEVDYLYPRAHIIETAKIAWKIAYYKVHFKDII